ncbi:glutamine synthetase [Elysia marginata]|uniref:Lengsin n=1 Tax=Elysia marginata TaxID=1093978 RepID=A0AAV4IQT0_9GAST|nr:glutamine synthetase [Elysia marginata]
MVADFKTASFVHLKRKGLTAEFMTCVRPDKGNCSGFHYNFSLWDSQGRNVFADPDDCGKLSELGRHWLAGMVEHAPAMAALVCPTINCYRRIGAPWAPKFANWSQEVRTGTFRLKIEPGGNVYIENRLPSSACSPHLVLAATLAAGMDGVRRKLDLPQPLEESRRLPTTLEKALDVLEGDLILKAALGDNLVDMYIYAKRSFEIDEFKAFGELSDDEMLLKEKEYYYFPY